MHRCHLELKKNSLTYFVQLLHKHGVRWTEKDVLKIVPVREGAESSLEWKEGSAAGRLPAEPSWSGRGKHNVLEASERQQEEKYSTSAPDFKEKKKKTPPKPNKYSTGFEYAFSVTWLYQQN